jgi:hypothetical protein
MFFPISVNLTKQLFLVKLRPKMNKIVIFGSRLRNYCFAFENENARALFLVLSRKNRNVICKRTYIKSPVELRGSIILLCRTMSSC